MNRVRAGFGLQDADFEKGLAILASACDPTKEGEYLWRFKEIVGQLAEIVQADYWLSMVAVEAEHDDLSEILCSFAGSPRDDHSAQQVAQELHRSHEVRKSLLQIVRHLDRNAKFHVVSIRDIGNDIDGEKMNGFREANLGCLALASYSVTADTHSIVAFCREHRREAFTSSHLRLIEGLLQNIEWLHRSLAHSRSPNGLASIHGLDIPPRRRQILEGLIQGQSNKEIAASLGLSPHTVGDHIKDLYRQFKVSSRYELMARIMQDT